MSSIVEVQENISEISINDPEHIAENSNETESTQKSLSSSLRSKIGSKSKETTLGSINEEHQSDSALADTVADLSPPERSQLLQAESHQFILDMGADIENQVIGLQESKMREAFDRKLTAMDERMTYKLQEDVDQLRSDVKTKYEQKIYNFLNEINDIFLNAVAVTAKSAANTCAGKIRQKELAVKQAVLEDFDVSVSDRHGEWRRSFNREMEWELAEMAENYRGRIALHRRQLDLQIKNVRDRCETDVSESKAKLKGEHDEQIAAATAKRKTRQKPISQQHRRGKPPTQRPPTNRGVTRKVGPSSLKDLLAEKLQTIGERDGQIGFCQNRIKSVIDNYAKLVPVAMRIGKSEAGYLVDKTKMLEKHLHVFAVDPQFESGHKANL